MGLYWVVFLLGPINLTAKEQGSCIYLVFFTKLQLCVCVCIYNIYNQLWSIYAKLGKRYNMYQDWTYHLFVPQRTSHLKTDLLTFSVYLVKLLLSFPMKMRFKDRSILYLHHSVNFTKRYFIVWIAWFVILLACVAGCISLEKLSLQISGWQSISVPLLCSPWRMEVFQVSLQWLLSLSNELLFQGKLPIGNQTLVVWTISRLLFSSWSWMLSKHITGKRWEFRHVK